MFDKRNRLSDQVAADVRANLGDIVYKTIIPRNVRISEAPSHGLPALVYDLRCPGSQAYIKLAGELIQRERAQDRGMMAEDRHRGLGRGLSALIGDEATPTRGEIQAKGARTSADRVPQAQPLPAAKNLCVPRS